jgi:predicted DNA-binding protein (UPF0251 family)
MTDQHHVGSFLANGSALRPEFRPYRWREPSSPYRARVAAAILAEVGDEPDSFGLPLHKQLADCGTPAAYMRHRRRHERPCEACAEAHRVQLRQSWRPRTGPAKGRADIAERLALLAAMRLHDIPGDNVAGPGAITAAEAAERLGVSTQTINRYKKRLRGAA